jgi:hypothetical protein
MPVGLVVLEVPNPDSVLEKHFARALPPIVLKPAFVLEPGAFVQPDKSLINFLFALGNLSESILCAKAIKHAIEELALVPDFSLGVREFAITVHEVVLPLATIRLTVWKGIQAITLS